MDLGAILLLVAALVLIGLYLAQPFLDKQRARRTAAGSDHELSALLAERDRVLNALLELDFDNALGKIPAEDYPTQRAALSQKGVEILRQLDALTPQKAAAGDAESRIEAVIASRRADAAGPTAARAAASSTDDALEAFISARRSERKEKSGGFCPKCGKPVLHSDRFCPNCGKAIK